MTNSRILAPHSTTKEEQVVEDSVAKEELEEMVEVEDQSLAISMDNMDIMSYNVIIPSQYVSIANHITILWKNSLSYIGCGRITDRSWKIQMFN